MSTTADKATSDKPTADEAPSNRGGPWSRRWVRYPVYAVAAWLAGCGLLAVGLPLALDRIVLPRASETIGRAITAERIRFNPFTLRLVAEGLDLAGTTAQDSALRINTLDVDLSARSLRHLAPVVEALRISGPTINIRRDAEGRFDFADILDRLAALPPSPEPAAGPARFALNNIELVDGTVRFDDRHLDQTHRIENLTIGLPFVSTLPDDIETFVRPALSAVVDGSALNISGETLPFHDSTRTELKVALRDLVIAPYLKLSPTPLGFTMPGGRLTTDLQVHFRREAAGNRLSIDGKARVDDLAIDARTGGRLLAIRQLEVALLDVEPLAGRFRIGDVSIDSPDVVLTREPDGELTIVRAFAPPSPPPPATAKAPAAGSSDPRWSVASTTLKDGRIVWTDRATTPAVTLEQKAVAIGIGEIGNRQSKAAPVTLSLTQGASGRLGWKGELDLAASRAGGHLDARIDSIEAYLPYFASALGARVATGPVTASTRFEAGWSGAFALTLAEGAAAVEAASVVLPDDKDPAVRLGRLAVDGLSLDLAAETVDIATATLARADVRVLRDGKGGINLERIAAAGPAAPTPRATAATSSAGRPATSPGWTVAVARVTLDDNRVEWRDQAAPAPVTVPVTGLSGSIDRVGTRLDGRSQADLRATIGRSGQLTAKGGFVVAPLSLDLNLQWRAILLAAFDPYLSDSLAVGVKDGTASGNGRLRYGSDRTRFGGRISIDGLRAAERRNDADLLRWKALDLTDLDVDVATGPSRDPDRVTIGGIGLTDFFARVELSPEGRFNLQDVIKPAPAATPPSKAAAATDAGAPAAPPMQIRLGGIRLEGGSSTFTDYFVKPNYTVNLSSLAGSVSAMASDASEPADVNLEGRLDGDAPIRIDGKLNPLGPTLYTDIAASAKGIDLPTFTPYSGKYAGYAIEKGKLSLDIRYRIENEKLDATNRLFLDQLTFGDKIDSPDALDLPIQFAIGLLKNRRGEIDISLPIGGSLNDPQFSIGGLVWQAISNLLTRIVTAPFTALASAFGGGEELSFVEFRPGTGDMTDNSRKRLETIAKALAERPALKLEIAGRMDPAAEAEAFGRARLDERLRALRGDAGRDRKDRDGAGASAPIPPEERPALLKRLAETMPAAAAAPAATTVPKDPRNPIPAKDGKDVADGKESADTKAAAGDRNDGAAIEQRLVKALAADTEAQRALATRRSQAARDWLTADGKVPGERIFLLAPRVGNAARGDGQKPTCTASCAEFSLR